MITIIDYGLGNIRAFVNLYERLNIPVTVAKTVADLANAEKLILPGVGSFDHALSKLNHSGMIESINDLVLKNKVPVIGICSGMQIMAESSEEGSLHGLGWIPGKVKKFSFSDSANHLPLPHMGWNSIRVTDDHILVQDMDTESRFYFLHSYYLPVSESAISLAVTEYGNTFTSIVNKDNIFGVQFHPEKSHRWGITILKNFAEL